MSTLLLAAGLVVAVAAADRRAKTDQEIERRGGENAPAPSAQSADLPVQPALLPDRGAEEVPALPAIASRSFGLETRVPWSQDGEAFDRGLGRPACESYGTAIQFLSRPVEAARQAQHANKLLFVLHVSGNFEDAKFT